MTTRIDESNVPTPAMVIDWAKVEHNSKKMSDYARTHKLRLAPHTKTHKSVRVAKLQVKDGAAALTVAKAGEAQVMSQAGAELFMAYPALDPARSQKLAELARTTRVRVGFDSHLAADVLAEAARRADSTLGVLVDVDVGMHRTGLQTVEESVALAQHVMNSKGLRLDGIMCYPGQIILLPEQQTTQSLHPVQQKLEEVIAQWKRHGLPTTIVSGGSTPTGLQSHLIPAENEIRPGTYIYYDWNCVSGKWCTIDEVAAKVVCTVVSNAVPGKFVIDAGSKTLTRDLNFLNPSDPAYGHVVEYPRATVKRLSEEHGEVVLNDSDKAPKLGDRVHVIPNHICPAVNLQTVVWIKHPDGSLESSDVDARGLLN